MSDLHKLSLLQLVQRYRWYLLRLQIDAIAAQDFHVDLLACSSEGVIIRTEEPRLHMARLGYYETLEKANGIIEFRIGETIGWRNKKGGLANIEENENLKQMRLIVPLVDAQYLLLNVTADARERKQ